jgi:hypothetical protein
VVDAADLLILFSARGQCPDRDDYPADLNGDETVDVTDLLILFSNWGLLIERAVRLTGSVRCVLLIADG